MCTYICSCKMCSLLFYMYICIYICNLHMHFNFHSPFPFLIEHCHFQSVYVCIQLCASTCCLVLHGRPSPPLSSLFFWCLTSRSIPAPATPNNADMSVLLYLSLGAWVRISNIYLYLPRTRFVELFGVHLISLASFCQLPHQIADSSLLSHQSM